jgi:hypothetical protein
MSINIPSYYFTDVTKRVPRPNIDNALKNPDFINSINNTHHSLDASNAINLSTKEGQAAAISHLSDEDLKKLNEAKKSFSGKIVNNTLPDQEITVLNQAGEPLAYYDFKNLVENLPGLDDNQKTTLRNAIITSTESAQGEQQDSSTYGIHISQTNMELKYISSKLVPEEYQEKFNEIADKYTDKLTEKYTNIMVNIETAIENTSNSTLIDGGWQDKAKKALDDIKNGTDDFHISKKNFDNLYKSIDIASDDTIKDQLSSVYDNFMSTTKSDQSNLVREVKYLSEKWNAVVDAMNGSSNLKFTTSIDSIK